MQLLVVLWKISLEIEKYNEMGLGTKDIPHFQHCRGLIVSPHLAQVGNWLEKTDPDRDYVAKECQYCTILKTFFLAPLRPFFSFSELPKTPSHKTLEGYLILSYPNVFLLAFLKGVLPLQS